MDLQKFDIVIIGAGISGLLIGSYLSARHSVLIIEKTNCIPNNKHWLTNRKCLVGNSELAECIDSKYSFMDFKTYDDINYRCYGDYILWDTDLLVKKLESVILQNAGVILKNHAFYSYSYASHALIIRANEKKIFAKLLIDCMGYSSPIIYAKNLIEIYGYYILHGRVLNLKKSINPIGLGNIALSSSPQYLEVFPKKNNQAYVVLIEPEKSMKISDSLRGQFKFIIEKSQFSEYFHPIAPGKQGLWGLVPIGKLRSQALDRIFLFGEAGQMNPSASATCLTQLLYSYKEIGEKISKNIYNNKLNRQDLLINNPYFTNRNRQFHLHLFNSILNWKSDEFRELVIQMKKMNNHLVNDMIFGELDFSSFSNFKHLCTLIKNRNYTILSPLFKALIG